MTNCKNTYYFIKKLKSSWCYIILLSLICSLYSNYVQAGIDEVPKIFQNNFSKLYNPGQAVINTQSFVYISQDTSASVFFRQNVNRLQLSSDNEYKFSVSYVLKDTESYEIVDKDELNYRIIRQKGVDNFYSFFSVNTPHKTSYALLLEFKCRESNKSIKRLEFFDNSNTHTSDNFFVEVINKDNKRPKYDNFVKAGQTYLIHSQRTLSDSLTVYFYELDNEMPDEPYNIPTDFPEFREKDSIFYYQIGDIISFERQGIYLFKNDDSKDGGFLLINGGMHFPMVKTVRCMLGPLRYLISQRRYNRKSESSDLKKVIDEFWFSRSNNERMAAEQIRIFYNRVQLANIYFTDFREGYRTDRGMIYIMFGAPAVVNFTENNEIWFYGENPEKSTLGFSFDKLKHPISEHAYKLRSGPQYQTIWGQVITTWRSGRVFVINR